MIKTIGYGGKKPTDFFKELEDLNPGLIVDVREIPFRAYLGVYTKSYLEKQLGKKYLWLPECGNVSRTMPPTLKDEEACVAMIKELEKQHHLILLLCAEKDEDRCHRSYIKKLVEES